MLYVCSERGERNFLYSLCAFTGEGRGAMFKNKLSDSLHICDRISGKAVQPTSA